MQENRRTGCGTVFAQYRQPGVERKQRHPHREAEEQQQKDQGLVRNRQIMLLQRQPIEAQFHTVRRQTEAQQQKSGQTHRQSGQPVLQQGFDGLVT